MECPCVPEEHGGREKLQRLLDVAGKDYHPDVAANVYVKISTMQNLTDCFLELLDQNETRRRVFQIYERQKANFERPFWLSNIAFEVCIPIAEAFRKSGATGFGLGVMRKLYYSRAKHHESEEDSINFQKKWRNIAEDYEKALEYSNGKDFMLLKKLSETWHEAGNPEKAIKYCEEALTLCKTNVDMLLKRQELLTELDRYNATQHEGAQDLEKNSEPQPEYLAGTNVEEQTRALFKRGDLLLGLVSNHSNLFLAVTENTNNQFNLETRKEGQDDQESNNLCNWEVDMVDNSFRLHIGDAYLAVQRGEQDRAIEATILYCEDVKPVETHFIVLPEQEFARLQSKAHKVFLSVNEAGKVTTSETKDELQLFRVISQQKENCKKKQKSRRKNKKRTSHDVPPADISREALSGQRTRKRNNKEKPEAHKTDTSSKEKRTKRPDKRNRATCNDISKTFKINLRCKNCTISKDHSTEVDHTCSRDQLYVQQLDKGEKGYIVRELPKTYNKKNNLLCDIEENCETCSFGNRCERPHSDPEMQVWKIIGVHKTSVQSLIQDLNNTSLMVQQSLEKAAKRGTIMQVCKACFKNQTYDGMYKTRHKSRCKEGHVWTDESTTLVFLAHTNEQHQPNTYIEIQCDSPVSEELEHDIRLLRADINRFCQTGFKKSEVVQEFSNIIHRKQQQDGTRNQNQGQHQLSESSDTEFDDFDIIPFFTCEDNGYYDTKLPEEVAQYDVDSPYKYDEQISTNSTNTSGRKPYYVISSIKQARENEKTQPNIFKECQIHLKGTQKAVGTALDRSGEIEINGRHNCGQAFDGDLGIIEILNVEVLDTKTTALEGVKVLVSQETKKRGRVVCITQENTRREAYRFVCKVDNYNSYLMKPICGKAPKIHVEQNIEGRITAAEKQSNKNYRVRIYEKINGYITHVRTVELDKSKEDPLFVVHYEKWDVGYMYPYGYVSKVLKQGTDLESTQDVINIMYQLPIQLLNCGDVVPSEVAHDNSREDLTKRLVFSIDPSGSQDIDDALSVWQEKGKTGETTAYTLGIHIADVSAYIAQGTQLDKELARRRISYYPSFGEPIHMLPKPFVDQMSLIENEDRRCLSLFIKLDISGNMLDKAKLVKTLIRNKHQLTYEEAQKILEGDSKNDQQLVECIRLAHKLAVALRKNRLQEASYIKTNPDITTKGPFTADARLLVEELMIKANNEAANWIRRKFPYSIYRIQAEPFTEKLEKFKDKYSDGIRKSRYFARYLSECQNQSTKLQDKEERLNIMLTVFHQLEQACEGCDIEKLKDLVGNENLHPSLIVLFSEWYEIQTRAEIAVVAGEEESKHYLIGVDHYTWFTSPLRRYSDVIVHRFITTALKPHTQAEPPYTESELRSFCDLFNKSTLRMKKHSLKGRLLKAAVMLKETALFIPGILAAFDETDMEVVLPFLPQLPKTNRTIKFANLNVSKRTTNINLNPRLNSVEVNWQRRIYDNLPDTEHCRTTAMCVQDFLFNIDNEMYTRLIDFTQWNQLAKGLLGSLDKEIKVDKLLQKLATIINDANLRYANRSCHKDATSEMKSKDPLIRHHAQLQTTFRHSQIWQVQVGVCSSRGILEPTITAFSITPTLDICIEHTSDPILCFAEKTAPRVSTKYLDIESYRKTWLLLIAMESAYASCANGDPIYIKNTNVTLDKENENGKLHGILSFAETFLQERHVSFNSADENECANDYLCLKFNLQNAITSSDYLEKRNIWIAHALTDKITTENGEVEVGFKIHHHSINLPEHIERAIAQREDLNCTVELIKKSAPYRFMTKVVYDLEKLNMDSVCKKIVLGNKLKIEEQKFDVELPDLDYKQLNIRDNAMQRKAIHKALTQRFTLIHGPPGTGKTLTSIKVAYWFTVINKSVEKKQAKVMYCGPSNTAVDVATSLMKKTLKEKCPKILRIYSETLENQVFPIPRDYTHSIKGFHYKCGNKVEKEYGLHYLIRAKSNSKSQEILKYDTLFKDNRKTPEAVTDTEIAKYLELISEAKMEEIPKYDIIFCTCTVSQSNRLNETMEISQVIVDECGMCTEPECLLPIVKWNPKQIVLVGDHKQLRPVVMNTTARNLGMDISLFERHALVQGDSVIMLKKQYRMHKAICEFPSAQFYENQLETDESTFEERLARHKPNIWPDRKRPIVFCHVEGAEKTSSEVVDSSNQHSKFNETERDFVVQIVRELVNNHHVSRGSIVVLSQYDAQCQQIKEKLTHTDFPDIKVRTVIASQGDEQDYVILTTVRSIPDYDIPPEASPGWLMKNLGFITDEHQINVALTRAKRGLIIIGNKKLLMCHEMWRELLSSYEKHNALIDASRFLARKKTWAPYDPNRNRRGQGGNKRRKSKKK